MSGALLDVSGSELSPMGDVKVIPLPLDLARVGKDVMGELGMWGIFGNVLLDQREHGCCSRLFCRRERAGHGSCPSH